MSFRSLLRLAALLCLLAVGWGVWSHAESVTAVTVTPVGGPLRITDGPLGGDPDLRVDLRVRSRWLELGTYRDQPLGEGRRWEVPGGVARSGLVSVRLVEDDPAGDDVIAELPVSGLTFQGPRVAFGLEVRRDLTVGLGWFLLTPAGMALIVGLAAATLLSFVELGSGVAEAAGDLLG